MHLSRVRKMPRGCLPQLASPNSPPPACAACRCPTRILIICDVCRCPTCSSATASQATASNKPQAPAGQWLSCSQVAPTEAWTCRALASTVSYAGSPFMSKTLSDGHGQMGSRLQPLYEQNIACWPWADGVKAAQARILQTCTAAVLSRVSSHERYK